MNKYFIVLVWVFGVAQAQEWSSNVSLTSDYLFNGISQTKEKGAIQAGLDYQNEQLFYLGVWGSKVDYANANVETDLYYGKSFELTKESSVTLGLAHYFYFGESGSSSNNYTELFLSWHWQGFSTNFWYSNDYFGTDARHYVAAITKEWTWNDNVGFTLGVDKSVSLDKDKYRWLEQGSGYWHGFAQLSFHWQSVTFSFSYHDTSSDTLAKPTLLFSIEKGFSW